MITKIKDEFHVLNEEGNREITLQKICDIIDVPVPEKFKKIKDKIQNEITVRLERTTKGCYLFRINRLDEGVEGLNEFIPNAVKQGVAVIFVDEEQYYEGGFDKKDYPLVPVPDIIDRCGRFFAYIKDLNDVKTIAVTGTCGKTTTMKFLNRIVPDNFKTYMNKGNANSYMSVADHIMKELTSDKEVYIQETGAAVMDSVRKSAAMLNVDACVLLNVFNHHINEYKTQENILKDKASFDNYMKDGGVVIANYDDENIAAYKFKHKVLTFGINTSMEVDFRAVNIVQKQEKLELDIEYGNKTVHLSIAILGIQNAYNAVAAFALCKWLGITDEKIVEGFNKYKSTGHRQNFKKLGGYNLLIDCYNLCEDSLKADLETIRKIDVEDNAKKIAVITGENKLGENAEEISFNMGKNLDLTGIEHVVCVGVEDETPENIDYYCHGRALYEGIKASGYENVVYVTNPYDMEKEIRKVISLGDLILFKGMYNLDLIPVIDRVFGTAIAMSNPYYIKQAKEVRNFKFDALEFKVIDALDLTKIKQRRLSKVVIPDKIKGIPVHRISPRLFRGCEKLKKLDLGNTITHIGGSAFEACTNLKKVRIPASVKVIGPNAFRNCTGLKEVIIENGVTHIDRNAFKGCVNLKEVCIPESVKYIDKTAFKK